MCLNTSFPSRAKVAVALVKDFPLIAPHLFYTLVELVSGFGIGAATGLVLAAIITQFPFVEKVITPYISFSSPRRCWLLCHC